jgi:hypothetical protein
MSEFDPVAFESELKRLKPAAPPRELLARMDEARPTPAVEFAGRQGTPTYVRMWLRRLCWVTPAAAAVGVAAAFLARQVALVPPRAAQAQPEVVSRPPIQPREIEIDQRLLSAFDAVAQLPGGEPVRFHCREWMDEIVLRDAARKVIIERQAPRLEVVPVRFETY